MPSISSGDTRERSKRFPTRTMKNSSRLLAKMAMNFSRSSRGTDSSPASSSTRRLNRSQLSSRLWVQAYLFSS